jgi:3-oxoacyl-[acyl-carrier protein] reductase
MKRILIVGASSGIGKVLKALLEEKGDVVISFCRQTGVDVTLKEPPFPLIEGPLDGIVYCPGTINLKPFSSLTLDDFQKDLEVNLLGAIKVIQNYLKIVSQGASIVLFSSVAARKGFIYHSSIASAKGAVEGFVHSFAQEMAPKIRINAIAPSLTETPLSTFLTSDPKKKEISIKKHPLGRLGTAEDMANMAQYLLSDKASFITGQVIGVDGGV